MAATQSKRSMVGAPQNGNQQSNAHAGTLTPGARSRSRRRSPGPGSRPQRKRAGLRDGDGPAQLALPYPLIGAGEPPTLVLNPALQLLAVAGGDAAPFLRRADWRPGERIEVLLQPWLLPTLLRIASGAAQSRTTVLLARQPGHRQPTLSLQLRRDEGLLFLTIEHANDADARPPALVGSAPRPGVARAIDEPALQLVEAHSTLAHMATALEQAQAETERISRAMHDSNAQLAHANDALEAMNEELLAANDRLTRSAGSIQAINSELNGILANQGFATFLVDAALRLQRFNPSAAALFGFGSADIGQPLAPRSSPIDALATQLRACIDRSESRTFPVHRDGRDLLVQINLVANARQASSGVIVSCVDETAVRAAERTLERQLRQSQKMQAMGQLTGGIAHDFNNILASIMGYADLLARTLGRAPPDDVDPSAARAPGHDARRYLGEILRASERARGLIQQLLLYSHGGGGRPDLVDVPRLIDESLSMLRSVFPATIELRTDHAPSLPQVLIDPVQANQVVMNLAINARDALQGRGRILLSADVIEADHLHCASCHANHGGRYVRLRVSDNGPGLAEGTQERVFEPFFTTRDVGQGTGLGLSVVHGIVHEHGGHIGLSTSPDGATFELLFPVAGDAPGAENFAGRTPDPSDGRSALPRGAFDLSWQPATNAPCVLIVDDEVPLATMLQELLAIHGYRAAVCHDAEAALERLERETFGCVLSDLTMPGMSGTEFAAALLQAHPTLPLCLYTGNRLLVDEQQLARLPNVHALLDKPVETRTLLQNLQAMCGNTNAH